MLVTSTLTPARVMPASKVVAPSETCVTPTVAGPTVVEAFSLLKSASVPDQSPNLNLTPASVDSTYKSSTAIVSSRVTVTAPAAEEPTRVVAKS